jgi:hypothetical protein
MLGERIRQTKHRMAGKIPDGRNRRAHAAARIGSGFLDQATGLFFSAAFPLEQVVF